MPADFGNSAVRRSEMIKPAVKNVRSEGALVAGMLLIFKKSLKSLDISGDVYTTNVEFVRNLMIQIFFVLARIHDIVDVNRSNQ